MGQPISDDLRALISSRSDVLETTPQHIIMRDGRVLDPRDFVVSEIPIRCVLKLTKCPCFFRRHRIGSHVMVRGRRLIRANGSTRDFHDRPEYCRGGEWVCEETLESKVVIRNGRSR